MDDLKELNIGKNFGLCLGLSKLLQIWKVPKLAMTRQSKPAEMTCTA